MNVDGYKKVIDSAFDLAQRKGNDYGGTINNITLTGLEGISVRLLDKVARVHNLTRTGKQQVKDESIRDTLIDMVNYAVYGVMMLDDTWEDKDDSL